MKNPEALVVVQKYDGGCDPLCEIKEFKSYVIGEKVKELYQFDNGEGVDIAIKNLILLK